LVADIAAERAPIILGTLPVLATLYYFYFFPCLPCTPCLRARQVHQQLCALNGATKSNGGLSEHARHCVHDKHGKCQDTDTEIGKQKDILARAKEQQRNTLTGNTRGAPDDLWERKGVWSEHDSFIAMSS
jgi:hypothetical protein